MKITTTGPVGELSATVTAFHEQWGTRVPPVPTFDAVARALGVAVTCTGNSDTAAESVTHTPKAGLTVSFYSVGPTHREEQNYRPLTAYYVAQWKDAEYRGHVIMSCGGYHGETVNGFVCLDQGHYVETLPNGCQKLVAELVTNAVIESGASVEELKAEWAATGHHYSISAKLYAAYFAMNDAARLEERGR